MFAGAERLYVTLDGEDKEEERVRAVDLFMAPGSQVSVFILTTHAGGCGLNLQVSTKIDGLLRVPYVSY